LAQALRQCDRTGGNFDPEAKPIFDRSSWFQLETRLRNAGKIETADMIYRERMREERRYALTWYEKPINFAWGLIAGYGAAPGRLAALCLLALLAGVPVFYAGGLTTNYRTDSRVPNDRREEPLCKLPATWNPLNAERLQLAAEISLAQFSPFKLPIGDDCNPKDTSRWVALFEKLTGLILVPLLVANLAGLLHRKTKATGEAGGGEE
jgi:hypothetical protein